MSNRHSSRRSFLESLSAVGAVAAAGAADFIHPIQAAAKEAGVKPADLPDLTIKEVKQYVVDVSGVRRFNSSENGVIFSMVTNSGIEGNYTDGNRGLMPKFLEYAKATCVGKSVVDLLPMIPSSRQFLGGGGRGGAMDGIPAGAGTAGTGAAPATGAAAAQAAAEAARARASGRGGPFSGGFGFTRGRQSGSAATVDLGAAYVDVMLWDILGKAVNRPIYKLLGGTKDRMIAYASSQHLATVEEYVPDAQKAKAMGFKAYKIHPGGGQHRGAIGQVPSYLGHIDEIREVRKAMGASYTLLFDPVQRYNVFEAIKVGRVLDECGYVSFEDPIPTTDIEGLIELRQKLDLPVEAGEFLYSIYDYAEYIQRGATDIVRLIADNVGGISGSWRIGQLADAFRMPCTPHNWGNVLDIAVHLQLELAMPNAYWVEMPMPPEQTDRVYHKDKIRLDPEGFILAPTAPGLGYPLDRDAMEKIMLRIDR